MGRIRRQPTNRPTIFARAGSATLRSPVGDINNSDITSSQEGEKASTGKDTPFYPLPTMPGPLSLFAVNAVLIMSTDDNSRIFAKYYSPPHPPAGAAPNATNYPGANPYPTVKEQKAFEKGLMEKTNKSTSDVILYDNRVVVFKVESDVMLYVVGSAEENEVLLYNVVLSLRDTLGILFKCVAFPRSYISLCEFPQLTRIPVKPEAQRINGRLSKTTTWLPSPSTRSLMTASSSRLTPS